MKHWHLPEISIKAREGSGQAGRMPPYPMDSEDAAMEEVAVCEGALAGAGSAASESPHANRPAAGEKEAFLARQIDRWVSSMERLQLSEYLRYVNDHKRMLWTNFFGGVARGVGTAVGFTILGAILVLFLQNLAKHNLPLIGDALAQIVSIVQTRLK